MKHPPDDEWSRWVHHWTLENRDLIWLLWIVVIGHIAIDAL